MSFVLRKGPCVTEKMYCGTSSALVAGAVAVFDVSTGAAVSPIIDATASLLAENVAGIVANTPAAADTFCDVTLIVPGQIWEYDCTSNCSTAMLGKVNDLTDSTTVANSTTISTANTGFVRNLYYVGATTDKKMCGLILGAQDAVAN